MKKTKIINGLLCTVLLLQSLTGVGVTVFADEGMTSNESTEIISQSLFESVGLIEEQSGSLPNESDSKVEENLSESNNELSSSETVNEKEIIPEISSEVISESTVNEEAESKQVEEKIKIPEDIIADGTYGTVPWYIRKEGTLVLEGGTLPDVEKYTIQQSPWYAYNPSVNKIVIEDSVVATAYGAEYLFSGLKQLGTIIGLDKIDFSGAKSLCSLFGQVGLESLDVSSIDVSQVTDFSSMFYGVTLEELDVSSWNMSNATSLGYIFYNSAIKTLDLSNWDTSNITDLSGLFHFATIDILNVGKWDTTNVSSIQSLFYGSNIDTVIGLENWYLPNLYNALDAFNGSTLKTIDLSNWRPNRIEYMGGMFRESSVESIDLSGWDTSSLTSRYSDNKNVFYKTPNLKKITLDSNTRFENESYDHQSENNRDDIWEGNNTKKIYENTTWLLRDSNRESDTFIRKEQIFHNVTFKDYYSIGNDQVTEVKEGETVWIPQNPTTEGYEFNGWYVDQEFSKLYNFSTPINEDITIYAKWVPKVNRVTFNSNGGTKIDEQAVLTGDLAKRPVNPELVERHFYGWFLNDWDSEPYDFSTPIQGDLELKARWSFILSFETNGAEKIPNQFFDYSHSHPVEPEDPWKKGYQFLGWYLDSDLTKPFSFYDGTELKKSTTLYAKYKAEASKVDLYGSLSRGEYQAYDKNFEKQIIIKVKKEAETFHITEKISKPGQEYYSISNKNEWLGYIPTYLISPVEGAQGKRFQYQTTANIKGDYDIWKDFDWKDKLSGKEYEGQTFHVKERYFHFNGSVYYSLYDINHKLVGYINEEGMYTYPGWEEGMEYSYDKYVTVKDNYDIWKDFSWRKKVPSSNYKNQTLHVRGYHNHMNGTRYLSLYDNQGKLVGYIDEAGAIVASGKQGPHQTYGKYVTIKGNYDIWDGFQWKNKISKSKYKNQTLHARGYYNHFNGSRYLSVYDNKGKWVGYINEKGTNLAQGQQGVYQKYGKYVTVKGNYKIWGNFAWSKSIPGSKYKNKTLQAKGVYNHFNGSRYLSLYDSKGKWVGYINENGTQLAKNKGGIALSAKFNRKVVKRNYTLWNDLDFKKKKGNSNQYLNQTLYVKVQYNHFNGSKYYSLYNANNKWLGYINVNGTK